MIILDKDITPVQLGTELMHGMQLSKNLTIDALTVGPTNILTYPYNIARSEHLVDDHFFSDKYLDKVPNEIKPLYGQRWKIASNLQYLAQGAMEPLIDEFGKEIVISSAFIHAGKNDGFGLSPHGTGEAIDIYLEEFQGNMFLVLGEIAKILKGKNVIEIGLCFNQRSWVHIGIQGPNHLLNKTNKSIRYFTRDFVTGEAWSGLFPARGLLK